jgi:ubiquinone/menaquinone biosynthesis C-methylase UbiE
MRLNWLGRATMNNAFRGWGQSYSASWLQRLGGLVEGGNALEIGCGRGAGVKMILEDFGAATVEAFDLDPKMIDRARRYLASCGLGAINLRVADVACIPAGDATFDAVFDFGAIHLVPNWRQAIVEVRRVLKPGGRFFFEWVTNRLLRLPYPLFTEGFGGMQSPRPVELMHELELRGINVGRRFVRLRLAAVTGVVGDFVGVGFAI